MTPEQQLAQWGTQFVAQLAGQLAQQAAQEIAQDPQTFFEKFSLFGPGCHTASDVAQDALDAWEHGQLSDEACEQIVTAVMRDAKRRKQHQPRTINIQ